MTKPTPEQIEAFLTMIREGLEAAENWSIHFIQGVEHRDNWSTGWRETFPTNGRTIMIQINGGAEETEGEPIR